MWAGGRRKRPFRAVLLGRQLARYWRLSRAGRRCRRRCRWSHGRLLVVALCAERRLRHRIARWYRTSFSLNVCVCEGRVNEFPRESLPKLFSYAVAALSTILPNWAPLS